MDTVTLTNAEAAVVEKAVASQIAVLMNDLVHADDRQFREQLKKMVGELEQVHTKLARGR